jgi:hypothetical protein
MGSMPAPLDPATAGVASLLKSLRTRAGLQEERLTGTELPLDVLADLPIVRELEEDGGSIQRAIVRAVRGAASSLEPTFSIIADVCLCLRLAADALPDPGLYDDELRNRRNALLRNWSTLHELRSASPAPRTPTLRTLRLSLEADALGALASALTAPAERLATTRAVSPAGRAVENRGGEAGAATSSRPAATGHPALLFQVFDQVASALRARLVRDTDGQPAGWPQDLRDGQPRAATPQATAYGLTALMLLEWHMAADLKPVVARLRAMELPQGGYATRDQAVARPEVTARVLEALHCVDGTADLSADISAMEETMEGFDRSRPYILSTVLECLVQVAPGSDFTLDIAASLLATRAEHGQYLVWPEKVIEGAPQAAAASVTHTARAVRALAQLQQVRPSTEVQAAIDGARDWLITQSASENVSEMLERRLGGDNVERTYIRHFTAAWVVKALVSAGLPASHPAVSAAIAQVWRRYSEALSLWTYRNGDVPIWMTADAIDALRLAALASIRAGRTRESTGVSLP